MTGLNNAIGNNIQTLLRQNGKKQNDLADALGVSKQIVSNMLSGNRMINAIELSQIAVFLGVTMERLMETSKETDNMDNLHVFMGEVKHRQPERAWR